jgi:uncharacterized protein (TIGR02246 family)
MKKRVLLTILVVLLLGAFTTASALSPQRKPPKVRQAIEEANEAFMAAFAAGDAAALAQMYTEDALLMVPNVETFEGRAEIEAFWEGLFILGIDSALLEIRDVDPLGNTAVEVSNYTLYAGEAVADQGKYIVEWKRVRGKWYLRWDIFNSSLPAP